MEYDRITRWLHAGIGLAVLIQLITSQIMGPAGKAHIFFEIHRFSGISAAALILMHWLWGLSGHVAGGWGQLFPWFSRTRRRKLTDGLKALPAWLLGKSDDAQDRILNLAGAAHGLGLLAVSAMALTGSILFFGLAPDMTGSSLVNSVKHIHMFMANFIWVYVIGHVVMAVIHQLRGERLITRMFDLIHRKS
jgi:cytochrome b561